MKPYKGRTAGWSDPRERVSGRYCRVETVPAPISCPKQRRFDLLAPGLSTISVPAARMECDRADRTGLKPAGDAIRLFGREVAGAAVYQYSVLVVHTVHIVHIGSSFSEPSAACIQQSEKPELMHLTHCFLRLPLSPLPPFFRGFGRGPVPSSCAIAGLKPSQHIVRS